ncbi:hypothetical protein IAT38_004640 [Cryptococcus sp. DSM 104549]
MSSSPEAESSGQALERYIIDQLSSLSLTVPQDDVEMIARFVEEEFIERDEKLEGVKGMLEGVVEDGVLPESGIDEALERVIDEQVRLHQLDLERQAAEEEAARKSPSPPPQKLQDLLDSMTPEEKEAARRQALLRQYAYVDTPEDEVDSLMGVARDGNAPPRGSKGLESEEKRKAEERRKALEQALKMDGKKKKYRKQQEVDLLAPNLNREKVQYAAQMQREAAKREAADKKSRDKAALDKQRNDQAQAKLDRQKKAAKQERRA